MWHRKAKEIKKLLSTQEKLSKTQSQSNLKSSLLVILFVSPRRSVSTLESGDTPGTWEKLYFLLSCWWTFHFCDTLNTWKRNTYLEQEQGRRSRNCCLRENRETSLEQGINLVSSEEGDQPLPAVDGCPPVDLWAGAKSPASTSEPARHNSGFQIKGHCQLLFVVFHQSFGFNC